MRNEIEQTLQSERVALHEWFQMKTKRPTFEKKISWITEIVMY